MAQPSTEHYDLSETEKRDLIKLIEQGKPLPEKYASNSSQTSARSSWSGTAKPARSAPPSCPSRPSSTSTSRARKPPPRRPPSSTPPAARPRAGPTNSSGATTSSSSPPSSPPCRRDRINCFLDENLPTRPTRWRIRPNHADFKSRTCFLNHDRGKVPRRCRMR